MFFQASVRARRGAQLLDKYAPGWAGKIDQEKLDLGSPRRCILAQLHGSYWEGRKKIFPELFVGDIEPTCLKYGFWMGLLSTYPELNRTWRKQIKARLAAA